MFRILLALTFAVNIDSARILGYFPVPSISHQVVYRSLLRELSVRGHEVVIVTTDPFKEPGYPNYTEIDVHDLSYELFNKAFNFAGEHRQQLPEEFSYVIGNFAGELLDEQFAYKPVKDIIKSDLKFDLVFYELLLFPAAAAFGHKFQAPLIGISSLGLFYGGNRAIGNPVIPPTYTECILPYSDKKTFYQRFRSLVYVVWWSFWYYYYLIPKQDALVLKHFGHGVPSLAGLEMNISLTMSNIDFVTNYPQPNVPNSILIGGGEAIHFRNLKPLPKELQEYLDSAKEGVVYFSLGSNVKSSQLPLEKRQIFLDAFKKLKYKVIWKWETEELEEKPSNVKIQKWLPQFDLLGHPNIVCFISQGGLQSINEATYHSKPLIIIPFFADQDLNAKKLESHEVAIHLNLETLTPDKLVEATEEIVRNPKYKNNMKEYSTLTKDQPQTPMEKAIWWTEYVLRHKGAPHLRSAAVDMPIYQILLLDVIGFLLVVLYITYFITKRIIRSIFTMFRTKKKTE